MEKESLCKGYTRPLRAWSSVIDQVEKASCKAPLGNSLAVGALDLAVPNSMSPLGENSKGDYAGGDSARGIHGILLKEFGLYTRSFDQSSYAPDSSLPKKLTWKLIKRLNF